MKDEELFKLIGHNIRIERAIRNFTQARLAEMIDVHEKYIGIIEKGKQNITLKTLNKIANTLNIELSRILNKKI